MRPDYNERMDARIACFIGWSNTGKTGFVEQCIAALRASGVSVGAIKCVHHGASFNLPGKDSTRFFAAGAVAALVSDDETIRIEPTPGGWGCEYARSVFPGAEVILVEGRLLPGTVKVLVGGPARTPEELKRPLSEFDALITDSADVAEAGARAGLVVLGSDQARLFTDHFFREETL